MARASSNGWAGLFATAFKRSRNAMILVDAERRVVDVNPAMLKLVGYRRAELLGRPLWTLVAGGPLVTPAEWAIRLSEERFAGEAGLVDADGTVVAVQWGATSEMVTGHRLVLFVALST